MRPRPGLDPPRALHDPAVAEIEHRNDRGAGQALGLLPAGRLVERRVGKDPEPVRADDLRVMTGVAQGVVGPPAGMAAGPWRGLPGSEADVELHGGGVWHARRMQPGQTGVADPVPWATSEGRAPGLRCTTCPCSTIGTWP